MSSPYPHSNQFDVAEELPSDEVMGLLKDINEGIKFFESQTTNRTEGFPVDRQSFKVNWKKQMHRHSELARAKKK